MGIDIVFKIAGIGILVSVINQILSKAGRDDMAMLTTLAGVCIVLLMVVSLIADVFIKVRTLFQIS